jgi:hypothetical protein
VRVRDELRVQSVLRHLLSHQCVALVGPANSEKSHLLADVIGELDRSGRFLSIYVDLWQAASTDETAFFASLASLVARALGADARPERPVPRDPDGIGESEAQSKDGQPKDPHPERSEAQSKDPPEPVTTARTFQNYLATCTVATGRPSPSS